MSTGGFPSSWCYHHEQTHEPMEWRDGCQSQEDIEFEHRHLMFDRAWRVAEATERDLRWWRHHAGRGKRWAVCWWRHRTRSCWACADPQ